MSHHKHLTIEEREKILYFLAKGYTISKIATELNRHKSTISRELKRNSSAKGYFPSSAQRRYNKRRKACGPKRKLADPVLLSKVKDLILNHQWSPEQISNRMKLEETYQISTNTIYRAIYSGYLESVKLSHGARGIVRKLRHRGKRRHCRNIPETRGKIKISNPIAERPVSAENRSRKGHWEGDTVLGKIGKACLVTLVDRKSRYLVGGKALRKSADCVSAVMIESLKNHPKRSITPDRGKEFSMHEDVTAALGGTPFYFPLPHHPWQRGTNENTNGLLREYFPKGVDISGFTNEDIQRKFDELNKRPRKCLGYKTPFEIFFSKSLHLT